MDYLTKYYKNLSEDLQFKVNFLSYRVKLLTEGDDAGGAEESNPYMQPNWVAPEFNPNQPTSPQPPQSSPGWSNSNPQPNPNNYPGGPDDPDFQKDMKKWQEGYERAKDNYYQWMRNQRGINRHGDGRVNRDPDVGSPYEAPLPPWQGYGIQDTNT